MSSPQATSRPRIPRRGADREPAVPRLDEPVLRPRRTRVLSVSSHVLPFEAPAAGDVGALDDAAHGPRSAGTAGPAPAPSPAHGAVGRRTVLIVAVPVVVALGLAAVALLPQDDQTTAGGGATSPAPAVSPAPPATGLDPDLEARFAAAVEGAAADGVPLTLTSGWRSADDQAALVESALATHGSPEEAHRWVLPPERSAHVSGLAVDVGPTDGALWLEANGAEYGLCRVYANEVWHFEPVVEPGGTCPELLPDSSSGWDGTDL